METYIDIHCHILPGVDDGSDSMETSLKMLRMADEDGISDMILTPHNKPWHSSTDHTETRRKVERLQEQMRREGLAIGLHMGEELYYHSGLTEELDQGMAETLAGSQYILVEFEPLADYDYIRNGLYALLMGGYYPIAAHVERYKNVCCKTDRIAELVEMGCFMQVNAASIMGQCGHGAKQLTRKMLKQKMIHFVATDAHDLDQRPPCLSKCAEYIGRKYGERSRRRLFYEHPICVLHNEYIGNREEDWYGRA